MRWIMYLLVLVGVCWPTFARTQSSSCDEPLSSATTGRTTERVEVLAQPEIGVKRGEVDERKRITITGVDCSFSQPWLRIVAQAEENQIEGWIPAGSVELSEESGLIHRYADGTCETVPSFADVEWRRLGFVRSPQQVLQFNLQGETPEEADIYYKDQMLGEDDIKFEGFTAENEHQFLLSAPWAFLHPGWVFISNWSISWDCPLLPPSPTPNA